MLGLAFNFSDPTNYQYPRNASYSEFGVKEKWIIMQAGVTTQAFPLGICVFMWIVGREEGGRCRQNDSQQASCVGLDRFIFNQNQSLRSSYVVPLLMVRLISILQID